MSTSNARDAVLGAVRSALAANPTDSSFSLPAIEARTLGVDRAGLVHRFTQELEAVGGVVHHVEAVDDAARVFASILQSGKVQTLAVSNDPLANALSKRTIATHEVIGPDASRDAIGIAEAGLTGGRFAIAEHGTVVMCPKDDHGRLIALLPQHHIAVLFVSQLLGTLAECLTHLALGEVPATTTFVSGPSRTADIEQTLVVGIHGPAQFTTILIDEETVS